MRSIWVLLAGTLVLAGVLGFAMRRADAGDKKDARVYELRIYHVAPGKMASLNARFRDHTNRIFAKHGMTIVGFWVPTKPEEAEQKLIYILSFPSADAAKKSWQAFRDDPEWKAARAASMRDGRLVERVESTYMSPTDYSPLK